MMNEKERLEAYEQMQKNVRTELERIAGRMEQLKAEGKIKSATYKELMGRKMVYTNMLSLYEMYGLSQE